MQLTAAPLAAEMVATVDAEVIATVDAAQLVAAARTARKLQPGRASGQPLARVVAVGRSSDGQVALRTSSVQAMAQILLDAAAPVPNGAELWVAVGTNQLISLLGAKASGPITLVTDGHSLQLVRGQQHLGRLECAPWHWWAEGFQQATDLVAIDARALATAAKFVQASTLEAAADELFSRVEVSGRDGMVWLSTTTSVTGSRAGLPAPVGELLQRPAAADLVAAVRHLDDTTPAGDTAWMGGTDLGLVLANTSSRFLLYSVDTPLPALGKVFDTMPTSWIKLDRKRLINLCHEITAKHTKHVVDDATLVLRIAADGDAWLRSALVEWRAVPTTHLTPTEATTWLAMDLPQLLTAAIHCRGRWITLGTNEHLRPITITNGHEAHHRPDTARHGICSRPLPT